MQLGSSDKCMEIDKIEINVTSLLVLNGDISRGREEEFTKGRDFDSL